MSHNFDSGAEKHSETTQNSLNAIARRLDHLQRDLSHSLTCSQSPDRDTAFNPDFNRAEVIRQLQADAALLRQIASQSWAENSQVTSHTTSQITAATLLSFTEARSIEALNEGEQNKSEQNKSDRPRPELSSRGVTQPVVAAMLRFRLYANRSIQYDQRLGDWDAMYGYSIAEAEANPAYWLAGIAPEDREAIVLPALEALMTPDLAHTFLSVEYRFRRKDGHLRWFQAHLTSQHDAAADCWHVTCIETDVTERKQQEQQLHYLEERFSKAFRASPIAMGISHLADGRYIEVNDRMLELVEYSRINLIGKNPVDLGILQPEEQEFLLSLLQVTPGKPIEWWLRTRSGKRRLARIVSETIELNQEPHLLVMAEDVTDYRRIQSNLQQLNEELEAIVAQRTRELQASQAALQTSQRQLEAVLDNSPLVIYLVDQNNRHLMVNRGYEELVGLPRQALIGVSLEEIWGNSDPAADRATDAAEGSASRSAQTGLEHIRQVRETGQPIATEEVLYIRQQKRIYLSSKFPFFDSEGNLFAVGGICLDITERVWVEEERQRAEAVLAQREREYRTLVENSPYLIVRLDQEGRYLYVNPSFAHAFGVSQQDCIGKSSSYIGFPPEIAAICKQRLTCLFNRCEPQMIEFSVETIEGTRVHQSWAVPELDEQGNVISALIMGRDITDMKRAEQRLQQAVAELERLNRLKDEFLSTVSHELRTPVSNMKLSIRLLAVAMQQAGIEPDARMQQYLTILNRECDREISLINDLLDLQKLEANKRDLIREPIDLERWLTELIEPFQQRTQNRQQQLRLDLPQTPLPPLISDPTSLDRVLAELLNNACKYTPPGEQIVLRVRTAPDQVLLSVHNSGAEIPIDELPRIFDKFYRVPSADPWKQGGTGLGLALVKKLVEHLQGTIEAESSAGHTVFTVALPIPDSSSESRTMSGRL